MKRLYFIVLLLFSLIQIYSDDGITFYFIPGERLVIKDRQNIRISEYYEFNKGPNNYLGYNFREVKGILSLNNAGTEVFEFSGNYYIFQTLKRNDTLLAKMIEDVIPVFLNIYANGLYEVPDDSFFPNLQSFPIFPSEPVKPGDIWTGYGIRIVDPDRDGNYTRVKFICEYTYIGPDYYENRMVHYIKAQYAMRYSQGDDPNGDPNLIEISGSHIVSIRMAGSGLSIELISDLIEEKYFYANGRVLEFSGSILTFFEGTEPLNKPDILRTLIDELGEEAGKNTITNYDDIPDEKLIDEIGNDELIEDLDIELDDHPDGIVLIINKIHFIENKATVLPEEEFRLDIITQALLMIPDRTFFVVGHTTDIGTEEFLYELSVARAKAIVDALIQRGIPPDRLLYEGKGGTEPVVPNDSEENKTRNRRVEIIILED